LEVAPATGPRARERIPAYALRALQNAGRDTRDRFGALRIHAASQARRRSSVIRAGAKLIKTEHSNQSGNDGLVVLADGTKYVTSVRYGSVSR